MIELSVEDLHLDYGDNPVLKGVSMQLRQGEVVSLLGPSGSGKTTLLRAVAGLEGPKRGRITIGERTVYDLSLIHISSCSTWTTARSTRWNC